MKKSGFFLVLIKEKNILIPICTIDIYFIFVWRQCKEVMYGEILDLEIFDPEDQIFLLSQKEELVGFQNLRRWACEDWFYFEFLVS